MTTTVTITVTKWGTDEHGSYDYDVEWTTPAKWEICPCCEGGGTDRGASVECDGGGFTSSEWADQDDDFKRDYLAGVYDRPCGHCKGTGKILVIDRLQADPAMLALYDEAQQEDREYEALCRAERAMGA